MESMRTKGPDIRQTADALTVYVYTISGVMHMQSARLVLCLQPPRPKKISRTLAADAGRVMPIF